MMKHACVFWNLLRQISLKFVILRCQEDLHFFHKVPYARAHQNNEKCSFGNLDKVYQSLPISQEVKARFLEARRTLNEYLDSKISINIYGETPTRRRLLDVFVYGGLAHATPEKKKVYDQWKNVSLVYGMLEVEFCSILEFVLRIIKYVIDVNKKALIEMS